MHACCAPCTTYVHKDMSAEGLDVTGFFYNPNIHPYTEYEKRQTAMRFFAIEKELKVIYPKEYKIENFFEAVFKKADMRCLYCFELRLHETALHAKKNGFDFFSTTLLISPYQNHELLCSKAIHKPDYL